MPISQNQITTLDQLEEKLTLALTDLLLLRDSNNEDYKVKASTILQAAVDKAGADLIGGNVESGNTKAVTGNTVNATLNSYAKSYNYDPTKLDFNEFTKTGFYRIDNIAIYSNAPSGAKSYGQLIVSHNGDTITQIYFNYNDKGRMFTRCFNDTLSGGVTWEPIITETLLTSALEYTKISAAGNIGVSLTNVTYKELVIEIETSSASFTFNILKEMLTTSAKYFRDGYYYNANTTALCTVSALTTSITLSNLLINGVDEKANATINVYYR